MHNGEWDAYRHAYASGEMTREYGEGTANIAGEANEIYGDLHHDQPDWEKNMDRWNNATGREIGQSSSSSQETAQRVFDADRKSVVSGKSVSVSVGLGGRRNIKKQKK